jgi:hypothetical protein
MGLETAPAYFTGAGIEPGKHRQDLKQKAGEYPAG